ncbi:MAG: hypothetical protein AB7E78_15910 [Porticoccaceae bacterium]
MPSINDFLLAYVLRMTTRRACPATISRGTAESEKLNCFYTWVLKDGEHDFVVLQVVGGEAHGVRYNDDRSSVDVRVPLSEIRPASLKITHIYGNHKVEYSGAWSAARGLLTGWPYAYIHARRIWHVVTQWAFNRRSLPSRRRLELLREVIALAETTSEGVESLALMSARHGDRWAGHPSWWSHHAQLDDQLELLAEAGDLRKSTSGYRPTGQGLRTLDDADEVDRKHSENVRVQLALVVLTIASAVMAAAQAGVIRFPTLLDLSSSDSPKPVAVHHLIAGGQCAPTAQAASTPQAPPILPR